jgi:midasin (ATPase involved in ribosome maturation)
MRLFEWCDGSLVKAMKEGCIFLADEISLADDSVLERLNSVLEPERTLIMAEKGSSSDSEFQQDIDLIVAENGFQLLATMNPGGDYGKKEVRRIELWKFSKRDRNNQLSGVSIKTGHCLISCNVKAIKAIAMIIAFIADHCIHCRSLHSESNKGGFHSSHEAPRCECMHEHFHPITMLNS